MTTADWLNVLAILASPIIALQISKMLSNISYKTKRKESVFKTLMETRAQPLSYEHVRALNNIDVTYYKDKKVREAWTAYRDHLNSYPKDDGETEKTLWNNQIPDKMTDLLSEMATLLNYEFDKTLLKKGAYIPSAHGWIEQENTVLRRALVEVFALNKPLNVILVEHAQNAQKMSSNDKNN